MTRTVGRTVALTVLVALGAAWPGASAVAAGGFEPDPAGPSANCVAAPVVSERCPAWASVYDDPNGHTTAHGIDLLSGVTLSPDGTRIFTYGYSTDDTTGMDLVVIAYDATNGDQQWIYRYDHEGSEKAVGLVVSADGATAYVGGTEGSGSGEDQLLAIALNTQTGTPAWKTTYGRADYGVRTFGPLLSGDGRRLYFGGSVWNGSIPDTAFAASLDSATGAID
ncbi:MAG: hypothetical protein ABR600_03700, partial [Actinomycetota bacterium]